MADAESAEETTETAPSNAELATRVDGLESKLDLILGKLGGAEHKAHDAAAEHTEERLDRPTSVADEIRRQLDAQRATAESADREKSTSDRLTRLEQMTEKVPDPPQRRVEQIVWGRR